MERINILIVEDESNLARTLAQALRLGSDGKYQVETAGSAELAYPLLDNKPYNLVISDLRLPGDDGLSLINRVKESTPDTHTILMTGYGSNAVEAEADKQSEGYLTKPFDMLDLLMMVQKVVGPNGNSKTNGQALKQEDLEKQKDRRILIMEDDLGLRRIYSKALKKAYYDVHEASTIQAARDLLDKYDYEIFICDIHMGRERGTDLLAEYKQRLDQSGTQVVMCSAYGQYRYMTEEMGADYFLEKPISLGTLLTLVNRLLL